MLLGIATLPSIMFQAVPPAVTAKILQVAATMTTVARPLAILGMVLILLSWVAAGVLPDWANQYKGTVIKMLLGAILLGVAPDLVSIVLTA